MPSGIAAAFGRITHALREFTVGQRTIAIIGVAVLAVGAIALGAWFTRSTYSPLFSGLSGTDASEIVDQLEADGITYQLTDGGSTILVPDSAVNSARLKAAAAGLPSLDSGGYALLDAMGVTASEFQQSVTYKRAIEGELAATIESIDGVQTASVKLAIPEQSVFVSETIPPTASVFVDTKSGTTLSTEQVKAITHLTAASVDGLTPENVSVVDGALHLTVRKEAEPFLCVDPFGNRTTSVTSGMVSTWHSFAQAHGRFEIRAAFPASKKAGLHAALWLWPQDAAKYGGWPMSGEIDIAEMYSQWADRVIPYIHYLLGTADETVTNNYCMIDDVSDFHTYTLEWTPTMLTIAYDGQVCVSHRIRPQDSPSGSAPFDQPFMIALTQGLGIGTNAATSATELPATTAIDYVRVWK